MAQHTILRNPITHIAAGGSLLVASAGVGAVAAALLASPAGAATFTVTTTDNSGIGSLSQAIVDANASAGADTIDFSPGVTGTIDLVGDLPDITEGLTIIGPGSAALTISGHTLYHAFDIATLGSGGVTISGLTVTQSRGVEFDSGGTIAGGAISVIDTALTLDDVAIVENSATSSTVDVRGGGLFVRNQSGTGDVTITNSRIISNVADSTAGDEQSGGGGASIEAENLRIANTTIDGNEGGFGGGLIANIENVADLNAITVTNNSSTQIGGGVLIGAAHLTISDSVLSGNTSDQGMGAGYLASYTTVGGDSTLTITNTNVSNNTARDLGGIAIFKLNGTSSAQIDKLTATGNVGDQIGGLAVLGSADISSSTIANNTGAGIEFGYGAAVNSVATANINPAISIPLNPKVTIANSTVSGNSREGIGVYADTYGCGPLSVASSVSVCATSLSPQAPRPNSLELSLFHVLAADNGLEDVARAAFSLFSLIENPNAAVFPGFGTQFGVDPGLLPLQTVSNTVSVVPISFGSAAWNAGDPTFVPPPETDQRGLPRVVDVIDIGAYEVQEAVQTPKFTG